MKQIHELLCAKIPWYSRWHTDTHSSAVTWTIFILVALLAASSLMNSIMDTVSDDTIMVTIDSRAKEQALDKPWVRMQDPYEKLQAMNDTVFGYLQQYFNGAAEDQTFAFGAMAEILSERKALIGQAIEMDSERARKYFFGPVTREAIPDQLKVYLEEPVQVEASAVTAE